MNKLEKFRKIAHKVFTVLGELIIELISLLGLIDILIKVIKSIMMN